MADQTVSKPPFWSSLPGILTGVGAVVVAITGLITALYTTGVIGNKGEHAQVAAVNTSSAANVPPATNSGGTEDYRQLAGKWEVVETVSQDTGTRIIWHYDAAVSGNALTLTGKIVAIGNDKNLTPDEERRSSTFVMTLHGSSGMGEHRIKGNDDVALVIDATIKFADDLKQFVAKMDADGRIYTYTGRKL